MIQFDLPTISELRGLAKDILNEGSVEHSTQSLAIMRQVYGPDDSVGQREVDLIERNLKQSAPNRPRLHAEALASVLAVLKMSEANSLLDIGCGEGSLLRAAAKLLPLQKIVGLDADDRALRATRALIDESDTASSEIIDLRVHDIADKKLTQFAGIEAITLVEVVEHVSDKTWINNLLALKPKILIATTPNRETNVLYPEGQLQPNGLRHPGHVFEFTRQEFSDWANQAAKKQNYAVNLLPIGPADIVHGSLGQMAVFQLRE